MAKRTLVLSCAINISLKSEGPNSRKVHHRQKARFYDVVETFVNSESQIDCSNYVHDREEVVLI